jgi:ABC-type glycerol-3-phosphate transport system substrate-binding protein
MAQRKHIRQMVWLLSFIVFTPLLFAGQAHAKKTTIVHAHETSHGWQTWLHEAKAAFESANPDIEIEIWPLPRQELIEKLHLTQGTENFPDVVETFASMYYKLALQGMFADLNPHMTREANLDWKHFFPVAVQDATFIPEHRRAGERWMLPMSFSVIGVAANETHFAESGLQPFGSLKGNWNWQDFRDLARKLARFGADATVERYGASSWTFQQWVYNAGGWPFDRFVDPTKATLLSEPCITAISFLRSMIHEDRTLMQAYHRLYGGGAVASISTSAGPALTLLLRADGSVPEWSYGPQPKLVRQGTDVQSIGVSMSAYTNSPAAAWKWMVFLATECAPLHIANTGRPVPYSGAARRYLNYYPNPSPYEYVWIDLVSHPDAFGRPVVDQQIWTQVETRVIRPGGILAAQAVAVESVLRQFQDELNAVLPTLRMEK